MLDLLNCFHLRAKPFTSRAGGERSTNTQYLEIGVSLYQWPSARVSILAIVGQLSLIQGTYTVISLSDARFKSDCAVDLSNCSVLFQHYHFADLFQMLRCLP